MDHDVQLAERAYTSACLRDQKVYYQYGLTHQDFSYSKTRDVFKIMEILYATGKKSDDVAMQILGCDMNEYAEIILVPGYEPSAYVDIIKTAHSKNKLKEMCSVVLNKIVKHNVDDVIKEIESRTMEIITGGCNMPFNLADTLHEHMGWIEQRHNARGALSGIPTGFSKLDIMTGGFQESQMWVVAARPSRGKTALLLNMALHCAKEKLKVGIISAESTAREMTTRILTIGTGITTRQISGGFLSSDQMKRLVSKYADTSEQLLWFYDRPGMTLAETLAAIRYMAKVQKVDIIFVDYIQKIKNNSNAPRYEQVGEISSELKFCANRYKIPIIAASQLNREGAKGGAGNENLSASDQLGMDADVVLQINHEYNEERAIMKSWFDISKARDGETGIVPVHFDGPSLTFKEIR